MDTSKIIKGVVSNGRYTVTAPIVKEDYGLQLQIEGVELPETYQVDFSNSENSGTSVTMIGNADGVLIPRQFISTGKDVFAFLYHVGEDFGRTVYKFRIPNKLRPDRTNEEPTPEEQSVIDQTIAALNEAAETAQENADKAETAVEHYPQIVDGTWRVWDVENGEWLDTGIDAEAVDGVSPKVSISNSNGVHTVIITDADGVKTATIYDGLTIIMLTSSFVIPTDENGVLTQDVRLVAKFRIMRGNTIIDGGVMPNSRITLTNPNAQLLRVVYWREGVSVTDPQTEVTLPSGYKLAGGDSGMFSIKLRIGSTDYVVNPTWSLAKRGEKGDKGDTPTITASKTGDTTYIYADGVEIAQIKDGQDGSGSVEDVQINGVSIIDGGTANIPIADSQLGAVFVSPSVGETGLDINSQGVISTFPAPTPLVKGGSNDHMPITPNHQHESAFYGLAKAAGDTTQSQSSNAVGNYTDEAKAKIKKMIGANDEYELIRCITLEEDSQTVIIDTDESSSPFSLQGFMIAIVSVAATGATAEGYLKIALNSTTYNTNRIADIGAGIRKNTVYKNIAIMGAMLKGIGYHISIVQSDVNGYIVDSNGVINRSLYNSGVNLHASFSNQQNVHSVFVGTDSASLKLGAGSIIALYGIRA